MGEQEIILIVHAATTTEDEFSFVLLPNFKT